MIEFFKLPRGQKFRVGNTVFLKVYNPFTTSDAQIINCINLNTITACHCDDDMMVEPVDE